ncbi:hypothetical protein ATANTOWER_011158 [Ataeniobius toweri]|uniref:Secreted protein n=1 Tax=Ataeniobius toweri TaxID=208326 RepID=A0ABU7CFY7_9TELE|nr:hypothetical protein [Ataeniobius toweri]
MSGRRHPIILCAVLTTRDTSFLSCEVPTQHCHPETQSAFHRGPADICEGRFQSRRGQRRSGCSCTLSCPDHFPQDLIVHTKKKRLSYFVGVVVYFMKY